MQMRTIWFNTGETDKYDFFLLKATMNGVERRDLLKDFFSGE